MGDLVPPERWLCARLLAEDLRGGGGDGCLAEVVVERFDPGAGLLAPVVVQVVAGDLEPPAAESLDRPRNRGRPSMALTKAVPIRFSARSRSPTEAMKYRNSAGA